MAEIETCPKCRVTIVQGKTLKHNEYTARNQYMYVFAADDEPSPDLSKLFSGKPFSKSRKPLAASSCEGCGLFEFYGIAGG